MAEFFKFPEESDQLTYNLYKKMESKTIIMGIINATPDSFSDGGLNLDPNVAIENAFDMAVNGADIIDIGGEYDISSDLNQEGKGFSVFSELKFKKLLPKPLSNFGILGRFDSWNPPETDKKGDRKFLLAGLTYNVSKNFRTAINFQQIDQEANDEPMRQILCQAEIKF